MLGGRTMKFRLFLTVSAIALAGAANAASVSVNFQLEITRGTGPTGATDQSGNTFDGSITYDDANVTPEAGGGFSVDGTQLESMSIDFIDRIFTESNIDNAGSDPFITFNSSGTLVGLEFSEDVPNAFFFFIEDQSFSYEYSTLIFNEELDDDEQVTIAGGTGRLLVGDTPPPPPEIPLPASGFLLIGGLAGLWAAKRKKA